MRFWFWFSEIGSEKLDEVVHLVSSEIVEWLEFQRSSVVVTVTAAAPASSNNWRTFYARISSSCFFDVKERE
jgi:hypothetical protein